jgi:hypothetical protein
MSDWRRRQNKTKQNNYTSTTLPSAAGIPRILPLTKKLFITHDRATRMSRTHMSDIGLIVGQADHQPHGLPEVSPGVAHIIAKS